MAWTGPLSRVAGPLLLSATLLAGLVLCPSVGLAQITLDATAPPGAPGLGGPLNFTIPSVAGRLNSPNLFFSFGQFSVPTGGSATYTRSTTTPQASVSNIVSRVTGPQQSSIDGLLAVASGTAGFAAGTNLWLINPNGVIFGANGRLNVTGPSHVRTRDYLMFPAGIQYSARPPVEGEPLSAAAPTAFGFLGPTAAAITIQGSAAAATLQVPNSATNLARTLSIVGGDIHVTGPASTTGATILAPRGLVQVASVASAGEATIVGGTTPDLNVASFTRLGDISMTGKAVIAATANNTATAGGTVLIRAGRLIMNDSSVLSNARAPVARAPRAIDIGPAVDMQLTNKPQGPSQTL